MHNRVVLNGLCADLRQAITLIPSRPPIILPKLLVYVHVLVGSLVPGYRNERSDHELVSYPMECAIFLILSWRSGLSTMPKRRASIRSRCAFVAPRMARFTSTEPLWMLAVDRESGCSLIIYMTDEKVPCSRV